VRERVVGATRTERGRLLASELAPHLDFALVRGEQRRTAATRSLIESADLAVMPARDTSELTQAAGQGRRLGAADIRTVGDAIAAAAAAYRTVRDHADLAEVVSGYTPLRELQDAIVSAIDERGAILDRASHALGRIRRALAQAHADARERVGAILRSARYAKAIQEHIVTVREGRLVIPIRAEFASSVPGIVHDSSASGQTLFVEPLAAMEANNRVRTLQIDEEREIERILDELSRRIGAKAPAIDVNVAMLAAIDLLAAKAQVALAMDAVTPDLRDEAIVVIVRGRHPLLGARAVAQSLTLDETTPLLVVSGPNMGGKTVALKMAGLLVVMAYCGMQLPAAEGTAIGRFERVIADIGDEQSIADNASTFSAHLQRMREMLAGADDRTLAIVDEIGGGTEPSAGAALAIAMLEYLLAHGTRAIVATHSTELKLFAHSTAGVVNASVRFDPRSFKPTFELDVGAPGQSLAFALATTMGIDASIIGRAESLLETSERDYEAALAELSLQNAQTHEERRRLERERQSLTGELEALRRDRDEFDVQRRRFGARAEERMQQGLRDFIRELQSGDAAAERGRSGRPKVSRSQAALLTQAIEAMHRDLGIAPEKETQERSDRFEPGEHVRIGSLGQEATVVEDWDARVLVSAGAMKMMVDKGDVHRLERARGRAPGGTASEARIAAAARAVAELDVRGKRYLEAEPLVERWIDEALLVGNSPLRLIHGKGTGMLGRGLQEYLRAHPDVISVRYGNEDEGSTGVTIVELRA
jgi:DNA mismatch repair protein MutS2